MSLFSKGDGYKSGRIILLLLIVFFLLFLYFFPSKLNKKSYIPHQISKTIFNKITEALINELNITHDWVPTRFPEKIFFPPLALGTMVNRASPSIVEWVEFHMIQKYDRVIIIDDHSPNQLYKILNPYILTGQVWVIPINKMLEDQSYQIDEVIECRKHNKNYKAGEYFEKRVSHCQTSAFTYIGKLLNDIAPETWVSFFDIDEFMFIDPYSKFTGIVDFLESIKQPCAHLRFLTFGTSFNDEQQVDGLVVDNYKYHAPMNSFGTPAKPMAKAEVIDLVKTHAVNPKKGRCLNIDRFNDSPLLGNHYQFLSRKYWMETFFRRGICRGIYTVERENFLNACQCPRLNYFISQLKVNLNVPLNEIERAHLYLFEYHQNGFFGRKQNQNSTNIPDLPKFLDPNSSCNEMVDPVSNFPPFFSQTKCSNYTIRDRLISDFPIFCNNDGKEELMKKAPLIQDGTLMNNITYDKLIYKDYKGYIPFRKGQSIEEWRKIANHNRVLRNETVI